jgi:hypothetical protein
MTTRKPSRPGKAAGLTLARGGTLSQAVGAELASALGDWPRECRQCVPRVDFRTRGEMVAHMAKAHGIPWPAEPCDPLEDFAQAVEREEHAEQVDQADEARMRLALDHALAVLDGKRAEMVAAVAALAKELHNAGRLQRTGLHRATLEALSKCCSLEYELTGDTDTSSAFASDLGLEDALAAFEETIT